MLAYVSPSPQSTMPYSHQTAHKKKPDPGWGLAFATGKTNMY